MNLRTIYPYLLGNTWVFDDPRTGLKEEAFVLGMSERISGWLRPRASRRQRRGSPCISARRRSREPMPS